MPRPVLNLVGSRFGRLVVKRFAGMQRGGAVWLCGCTCGCQTTVRAKHLKNGATKSCGCLRRWTRTELVEQFCSWVQVGAVEECWPWTFTRDTHGYGRINLDGQKYYAHRLAWEISHGKRAGAWKIRHRCDNPCCCNPAHLFRGTQKQNMREAISRGRLLFGPDGFMGAA
jgi:hypothetical protein